MNKLNTLKNNRMLTLDIQKRRRRLKEEANSLKHEANKIKRDFIEGALNSFLDEMSLDWRKDDYVNGRYTDEFTKYVNRHSGWTNVLNAEHRHAINVYKKALEDLNRTFVDALLADKNGERERLVSMSGIKNLK